MSKEKDLITLKRINQKIDSIYDLMDRLDDETKDFLATQFNTGTITHLSFLERNINDTIKELKN